VISSLFCARTGRRLCYALALVLGAVLAGGAAHVLAQNGPGGQQSGPGGQQSASSAPVSPAEVKAQGSYSLGVLLGVQLHQAGLNASNVSFEKLLQGLRDATSGKTQPSMQDRERVQVLIVRVQAAAAQGNRAAAQKFLAENAKRPGVKTTPSGLQYKVVSQGSGASPHPTDQVVVNYRGTLLNGTEFDSSYKRGQPATFQVNGVIRGWTEALLMMKPGAKWQLYIPPDLAYGDRSPAPVVPPGSLLKFDVELVKIEPPASPGALRPNIGGGGGR
jgi:FKBP-type peptidyl-prolyl cis-trans isomerase